MQLEIPLIPIPAQRLSCVLNNQDCTISLYMRGENFYFDLIMNNETILTGHLVRTNQKLTPYTSSFIGNIYIIDTVGQSEPSYSELGTRFKMIYTDE